MPGYIDDNKPFSRMMHGIADKAEGYRKRFVEMQKQKRTGTFAGLEDMIAKRKQQQGAQNAKRNSH